MKRVIRVLGVLVVAMGGYVVYVRRTAPPMERLWSVPPFDMTAVTTAGVSRVRAADLRGRPWIADFIYTRCAGPCPILSSKMAELQRILPPEVRLVSFTVDPDNDTPEILRRYAARFNADPQRWIFVRGDKAALHRLAFEGFRVALAEDPSAPVGASITHSTKFSLVDAQGVIRHLYDGNSPTLAQDVGRDLARLK